MSLEDITIVVCSAFAVIFGFFTNYNTMPLGLGIFLVLCGGFRCVCRLLERRVAQ